MEDDGLIVSGNYNKIGYDRTKWYSINIDFVNPQNGIGESTRPIPDTKEDTKKDSTLISLDEFFEDCWKQYGRKGNKRAALRYWRKLSTEDRKAIHSAIPAYLASREPQFRKDFSGWINPSNRMWEDEVQVKNERISI
jgi:hypothetical protein